MLPFPQVTQTCKADSDSNIYNRPKLSSLRYSAGLGFLAAGSQLRRGDLCAMPGVARSGARLPRGGDDRRRVREP